ncbi:MAG: hypothetical protein WAN46_17905 [Gammaproteobacteria bacterium]|jgi:hypothetical protein
MTITTTLDPISLRDASRTNPDLRLREGNLEIYFESRENLDSYRNINIECPGLDLRHSLDNPTEDCGTDWN